MFVGGAALVSRKVSLSGVVLLCISFFLPQVKGCSEDVVPSLCVVTPDVPLVLTAVRSGESVTCGRTDYHGAKFLLFWGLPFLFGFVGAACLALRRLARSERASRLATKIMCTFTALILAHSCLLTVLLSRGEARDMLQVLGFTAATLLLVMCVASLVLLRKRWSAVRMPVCFLFCAASSFVYFIYMGLWLRPLFGLFLSILACLLIAIGPVLEILQTRKVASPP